MAHHSSEGSTVLPMEAPCGASPLPYPSCHWEGADQDRLFWVGKIHTSVFPPGALAPLHLLGLD